MQARLSLLLLLSPAALLGAPPLRAQPPAPAPRPASLERWTHAVNARFDRVIVAPSHVEGTTSATFRRADDGSVTDLRIAAASPALAAATEATLARLGPLPQLPLGIDPHMLIRVNLLFAGSDSQHSFAMKREALVAAAQASNRQLKIRLNDHAFALADRR